MAEIVALNAKFTLFYSWSLIWVISIQLTGLSRNRCVCLNSDRKYILARLDRCG